MGKRERQEGAIKRLEKTILAHLVNNDSFMRKVLPFIKEEYFADKLEGLLFKEIYKFINKYNNLPTKESLSIEINGNKSINDDEYKKIILADVNNYIAINTDGKAKCKGRFEFKNLALHKNKSKLVIPKAIYEYFVNGILPEDYLETNRNILDYCIGGKTNGGWQVTSNSIIDGEKSVINLQKINRYYISNQGVKMLKVNKNDGRIIQLEAGQWLQTVYNKMEEKEWNAYDINMNITCKQLKKKSIIFLEYLLIN